jgi:hypothetical protein
MEDGLRAYAKSVVEWEWAAMAAGKSSPETWADPGGELLERGRYFDISGDRFSFTLERSNDDGNTWIRPFVSFQATRRKPRVGTLK